VFHVVLPLAAGADDVLPAAGSAAPEPRGAGQHVLYVDDDEMMVVMVQGLLQGAGYRVTTCRSALSAVTTLREDPSAFDVVVTDFNMPGGSGLDVARAVRALRPGLPVVVSSGYLTEELRGAAALVGVRCLLKKENTVEELCALLREVLAKPEA
jgi:CheY-like chemotaxis protein